MPLGQAQSMKKPPLFENIEEEAVGKFFYAMLLVSSSDLIVFSI